MKIFHQTSFFKTFKSSIIFLTPPAIKFSKKFQKHEEKVFFSSGFYFLYSNTTQNSGQKGIYKQTSIKNKLLDFSKEKKYEATYCRHSNIHTKLKCLSIIQFRCPFMTFSESKDYFSCRAHDSDIFRAKKRGFDDEWNLRKDEIPHRHNFLSSQKVDAPHSKLWIYI